MVCPVLRFRTPTSQETVGIRLSSLPILSFPVLPIWVSCWVTYHLLHSSKVLKVRESIQLLAEPESCRLTHTQLYPLTQSDPLVERVSISLLSHRRPSRSMVSSTSARIRPVRTAWVFSSPNSWLERTRPFKLPELTLCHLLNPTHPSLGYRLRSRR